MEVKQKELAAILGVTDRRIRQLKEDYGLFQHRESGNNKVKKYCLEKCVPEYINYKLEAEVQGVQIQTKKRNRQSMKKSRKRYLS